MINSRQKGARSERELRDVFKEHGFDQAYRGQQFQGGTESPDVVVPELPWLHIECKNVKNLNIWKALEQAIRDAGDQKAPAVFFKRNGTDWFVAMPVEDWFELLIKAEENEDHETPPVSS